MTKSTWTKVNIIYKFFPRWPQSNPQTLKWKMPSNETLYSSRHFDRVVFIFATQSILQLTSLSSKMYGW